MLRLGGWLAPGARFARFQRAARFAPAGQAAVQHGRFVVAEVAQEPPEADGPSFAGLVVGDHAARALDSGAAGGGLEVRRFGQRMAAALARLGGEVAVDVEEGGARDVALEPQRPARAWLTEHVAAIDDHEARVAEVRPEPGRFHERSKGSSHGRQATPGQESGPAIECGPSKSRIWRL